jgi:hypothetical protein
MYLGFPLFLVFNVHQTESDQLYSKITLSAEKNIQFSTLFEVIMKEKELKFSLKI